MIVGQLKYVYFWLKSCQNAFDIIKPRSAIEIRCGSRQTPRLLPREISFFSYLPRQKKMLRQTGIHISRFCSTFKCFMLN